MNRGSCWPNGSYFSPTHLDVNPISCVHDAALDGTNDGGWILPSGAPCTSTTSPIQCTNVATDGPTNITLQRVASFAGMELVYKCCLPNDCDNGPTDTIIANIYEPGKFYTDMIIVRHTCIHNQVLLCFKGAFSIDSCIEEALKLNVHRE